MRVGVEEAEALSKALPSVMQEEEAADRVE
jgi:hypothetical protein